MVHIFLFALTLLSSNVISRVMCLRIAPINEGVCDSSQMSDIIQSLKQGVPYTLNSCMDESTWNNILEGSEGSDFEDIHEFIPMSRPTRRGLCSQTTQTAGKRSCPLYSSSEPIMLDLRRSLAFSIM